MTLAVDDPAAAAAAYGRFTGTTPIPRSGGVDIPGKRATIRLISPEQAAVEFAEATGKRAAIGSLDQIDGLVAGTSGTFRINLNGAITPPLPFDIIPNGGVFTASPSAK